MEASGGVVAPGTGVREGEAEREEARADVRRGPQRNWVRPLFMWIAVFFICVFCLFPFYWLINVSLKTVEFHKSNITKKLGLKTASDLTKYAIAQGLTSIHDFRAEAPAASIPVVSEERSK